MNEKLNSKQIEAVYNSAIRCIKNHDVGLEDLQKIWTLLLKYADRDK